MDVLADELGRVQTALQDEDDPPYWMGIEVVDTEQIQIEAAHGAADAVRRTHRRTADVDIRVGSQQLDNTHQIRDGGWFSSDRRHAISLPLEAGGEAVSRRILWAALDDAYRSAVKRLIKVRNNALIKVVSKDNSPDFSDAPVVEDIRPIPALILDEAVWLDHSRRVSAKLMTHEGVHDTNVSLVAKRIVRRIVTTEGTQIRFPETRYRIFMWVRTTAEDGMKLALSDYVDSRTEAGLPDGAALDAMADRLGARLTALRAAPVVEPFVGPAILRGRAAAVFFHEVLGHRVEGHRQKDEEEGQTFTDKVGERILPSFLSVVDDPTRARLGGVHLAGAYPYDDEGVVSEAVTLVERGILRGFLMSRSPIKGFARSNGHGRRERVWSPARAA